MPADLSFVPEPYRSMIAAVPKDSVFLIQELPGGEPVRVYKVPAEASASQLLEHERQLANKNTSTRRVSGKDLRSLILELARANGEIFGFAIDVNA